MSKIPFQVIRKNLMEKCTFKHCQYSTALKIVPKADTDREKTESYLKEFQKGFQITERVRTKKPQRPPFAKNLFLGKFDAKVLEYPELEKEDTISLNKALDPLCNVTEEHAREDYRTFIKTLAELNFLGLQSPQIIGGRDFNISESARVTEAISGHISIANLIANEYLGIQAIAKFGNEAQKKKYLTKLISGEITAAFCLLEDRVSNLDILCTKAEELEGSNNWVINGEKIWTLNGNTADIFIVLAETGKTIKDGMEQVQITPFIVDRNQEGVHIVKYPIKNDNLDISHVGLTKVIVSQDDILGNPNDGKALLQKLIPEFRLMCGIPTSMLTRRALNEFTKFCVNSSIENLSLYETDEVLSLTGHMSVLLYAMESITYLTTGLMDNYENQDCELEAAIVKTFNAENAMNCITSCVNFIGTSALLKDHWCNNILNETLKHVVLQESQENMKIMIALMGLQHAGITLKQTINKLRNPLFNSGFIFKRLLTQRRHIEDRPKLNMGLEIYLHPTLENTAKQLEYCTLRLEFGTELLLMRHGSEVVNQHTDLKRLAECVMYIYAMTACLGRASRAYCIGLQNSEYEMMMANVFCNIAKERIQRNVNYIYSGDVGKSDKSVSVIAKRTFKFKEYPVKHALTRNF